MKISSPLLLGVPCLGSCLFGVAQGFDLQPPSARLGIKHQSWRRRPVIPRHLSSAVPDEPPPSSQDPQETALTSVTTCSRAAAISAVVDGVTNWQLLFRQQHQASPATGLTVLNLLWKVGFAAGLYQSVRLFRQGEEQPGRGVDKEVLQDILTVMAPLWRRTAWMVLLSSVFEIFGEPKIQALPYARPVLGTVIALGSLAFQRQSALESAEILGGTQKNMDRVSLLAQRVVRNMALCTGALLCEGATTAGSVFVQPTWLDSTLR